MQELTDIKKGELKTQLLEAKPNPSAETQDNEEVVKDLLIFREPLTSLSNKYLISAAVDIISSSLIVSVSMVGSLILSSAGFICLNILGDALIQASFGLFVSYQLVFFFGLNVALMDKTGLSLSQAFGEGNFRLFRKVTSQGIATCLIVFGGFTIPMMLFSKNVLTSIGIAPENAAIVQTANYLMLPVFILQTVADFVRTICMAQGHETIFGKISTVNSLVCCIISYLLVVKCNMSILGWIISKTLYEIGNLAASAYVYKFMVHEQTRGVAPVEEAKEGFWEFFVDSLKFCFGSYSDLFGFESTTYFIALSHDNNIIAAWSSIISFAYSVYTLGMSFSVTCRTRVNILVGMNRLENAKNFFLFHMYSTFAFGVTLAILLFLFMPNIMARVYANANDTMREYFVVMFKIYCVAIPSEVTAYSSFTGVKTIGKVLHIVYYNIIFLISANAIGDFILMVCGLSPTYMMAWTYSMVYVVNILCFITSIKYDWTSIKAVESPQLNDVQEEMRKSSIGSGRRSGYRMLV